MLWTIGFMVTFVIGGLTGVLLAVPPADFVLHNSVFLVAHFHNVIIGGVLFGAMAGYNYWFPKAFGFTLDRRWGAVSFWCWLIGFYLAFMPLYVLGLLGMTRRLQHYADPSWQPYLIVAEVGALIILCGIVATIAAARGQHPYARAPPRPHRRSLERPDARMGHRLAAARLQLRRLAAGRVVGRVLGHEAARTRAAGSSGYEPIASAAQQSPTDSSPPSSPSSRASR